MTYEYPFAALVGQENMKRALLLNAIAPQLSGVLIQGEKGTAKSTAVRALAALLPQQAVVEGCPFGCDPEDEAHLCPLCGAKKAAGQLLVPAMRKARVVELPVSATEDRVVGTLDIEAALKTGEKKFEPGLLAQANRNILYVDEVNLLEDHIVDVLLDAAAMGVNTVEREGISYSHPARFVLVGTMNPEEGDLRPQLLDRFGLSVQVHGESDPAIRAEVVRRRLAFEEDPAGFCARWEEQQQALRARILAAQQALPHVQLPDDMLALSVNICLAVGCEGHRADITLCKTAMALAAWEQTLAVTPQQIEQAALLVLPHRMRRKPFEEAVLDTEKIHVLVEEAG